MAMVALLVTNHTSLLNQLSAVASGAFGLNCGASAR